MKSIISLMDGETKIIGGVAGREPTGGIVTGKTKNMQPTEGTEEKKKSGNIIEIALLTVKKGETRVMEGSPKRVKAVTLKEQ